MKKYLLTFLFTVSLVLLYSVVNIHFFFPNLPQKMRYALFSTFAPTRYPEPNLLILNAGKLGGEDVSVYADSILAMNPAAIGIIGCDIGLPETFVARHSNSDRVIISTCKPGDPHPFSRIIDDGNIVTHFAIDKPDYFEIALTRSWNTLKERGHPEEMINFREVFYSDYVTGNYWQIELAELKDMEPGLIEGKIVLLGYVGEHISKEIVEYKNCRITPMNPAYGQSNIGPDMHDLYISANIMSTIMHKEFIEEVSLGARVLIILLFALLNVVLVTYIRTKWLLINLVIRPRDLFFTARHWNLFDGVPFLGENLSPCG